MSKNINDNKEIVLSERGRLFDLKFQENFYHHFHIVNIVTLLCKSKTLLEHHKWKCTTMEKNTHNIYLVNLFWISSEEENISIKEAPSFEEFTLALCHNQHFNVWFFQIQFASNTNKHFSCIKFSSYCELFM